MDVVRSEDSERTEDSNESRVNPDEVSGSIRIGAAWSAQPHAEAEDNFVSVKAEPCDHDCWDRPVGELTSEDGDVMGCAPTIKVETERVRDFVFVGVSEIKTEVEADSKSDGGKPQTYNMRNRRSSPNVVPEAREDQTEGERPHGKRRYRCEPCDRFFSKLPNFTQHMLRHTIDRPYKCRICDEKFPKRCDLKTHSETHKGERRFKCAVCEKKFTCKSNLNQHALTHDPEKRHACPVCGKKFTLKYPLDMHVLTHTTEKPHTCKVCDKAFYRVNNLNQHMLSHSDAKVRCRVCEREVKKTSLSQHMQGHTVGKTHACHICEKKFTQKSNLNRHIMRHASKNQT